MRGIDQKRPVSTFQIYYSVNEQFINDYGGWRRRMKLRANSNNEKRRIKRFKTSSN